MDCRDASYNTKHALTNTALVRSKESLTQDSSSVCTWQRREITGEVTILSLLSDWRGVRGRTWAPEKSHQAFPQHRAVGE